MAGAAVQRLRRMSPTLASLMLSAALALVYAGWSTVVVSRDKPLDFNLYYLAGLGLREGRDIYAADVDWAALAREAGITNYGTPYRYPPLTAALALPLTTLEPRAAALVWNLASGAAFIGAAVAVGAATGLAWGVPLALGVQLLLVPALSTIYNGQVNAFLLLALALALLALLRGRESAAGGALAVGVAFKVLPVAHLCWLAATRRWRPAAAAVAAGAVLAIAIGLSAGWPVIGSYLRNFSALGIPGSLTAYGANQAFNGLFARWLGQSDPTLALVLARCASLAIVAATAAVCLRRRPERRDLALGFSLVTIAVNLVTPYAWYHQLCLLLIPITVLAAGYLRDGSRARLGALVLAVAVIDVHGLFWHRYEHWGAALSAPLAAELGLWGLTAAQLLRPGRAALTSGSAD